MLTHFRSNCVDLTLCLLLAQLTSPENWEALNAILLRTCSEQVGNRGRRLPCFALPNLACLSLPITRKKLSQPFRGSWRPASKVLRKREPRLFPERVCLKFRQSFPLPQSYTSPVHCICYHSLLSVRLSDLDLHRSALDEATSQLQGGWGKTLWSLRRCASDYAR